MQKRRRRDRVKGREDDDDVDDDSPETASAAAEPDPSPDMTDSTPSPRQSPFTPNVVWALVTGLAVGFTVGREVHRLDVKSGDAPAEVASAVPAVAPSGSGGHAHYDSLAAMPSGWTKSLPEKYTNGLTDAQKLVLVQALNERDCECGCSFGELANCVTNDPNCPRSPVLAQLAVDEIKAGKALADVLAAIDAKQKELGSNKPQNVAPPAPEGRQYVELAAYNPRIGPKDPLVTVVEFSDFQ